MEKMAPSKCTALLLTFAVAAAALQPSEARVQGLKPAAANQDQPSPPPPPSPSRHSPPLRPPPSRSPHSPPSRPPPPPSPHSTASRQVTCMEPLSKLLPCVDYLTKTGVRAPPNTCCDGLSSVVRSSSNICLCHAIIGDLQFLGNKTIDQTRMVSLPFTCSTLLPLEFPFICFLEPVPPVSSFLPPLSSEGPP